MTKAPNAKSQPIFIHLFYQPFDEISDCAIVSVLFQSRFSSPSYFYNSWQELLTFYPLFFGQMRVFSFTSKQTTIIKQRICKDDHIKLIMECHQSELSDYQWCERNEFSPSNFYNWVSKLCKCGYIFSEPASKSNALPNIHKVVKVDLIPFVNSESSLLIEQKCQSGCNLRYKNNIQQNYTVLLEIISQILHMALGSLLLSAYFEEPIIILIFPNLLLYKVFSL